MADKTKNKMKSFTIKNFCGQKTLIINDISSVDVKSLYIQSCVLNIPFAIKQEVGIQIWGLFTVADFLGIKDCSTLIKEINLHK